jgi:hypothetical protein
MPEHGTGCKSFGYAYTGFYGRDGNDFIAGTKSGLWQINGTGEPGRVTVNWRSVHKSGSMELIRTKL